MRVERFVPLVAVLSDRVSEPVARLVSCRPIARDQRLEAIDFSPCCSRVRCRIVRLFASSRRGGYGFHVFCLRTATSADFAAFKSSRAWSNKMPIRVISLHASATGSGAFGGIAYVVNGVATPVILIVASSVGSQDNDSYRRVEIHVGRGIWQTVASARDLGTH